MNKCSILGCAFEFVSKEKADLHAATSWHCVRCGYSDDKELTLENVGEYCTKCIGENHKCIRVNFKRKAYVIAGRLSIKENGRWVHYE